MRTGTTAKQVIETTLELADKRVLDVGCGDGKLVRLFARRGAQAIGVDPQPEQIARAEEANPQQGVAYIVCGGQSLPFSDERFDLVTFFNSLHHVPLPFMTPALAEAARVLKLGGLLWVWEPIAEGSAFELYQPVDDETEVRAQADAALTFGIPGLTQESRQEYDTPNDIESFEAAKAQLLAVDSGRAKALALAESEMRRRWETLGEERPEGGKRFIQPARLVTFRKAA